MEKVVADNSGHVVDDISSSSMKDFSKLLSIHKYVDGEHNVMVLPRQRKNKFKVRNSPSIDLSNVRDLHKADFIYLNNHRSGHFTLNAYGSNIQTAESGDGVVFKNMGKFPEYKLGYFYRPQIYGSKYSPLLESESVTIVYKDGKSVTFDSHTMLNAIELKIHHPVVFLCISGIWNCKLLINGDEKDFVKSVNQYGRTFIYFENVDPKYQKGGSSDVLSEEQRLGTVNFSRLETVFLQLHDPVNKLQPEAIEVEWWDYMSYITEAMIQKFVD